MQALVKTWPVALVLAAVLIAMGFVTTRQAAETTSGTWDETIYLALGRSLAAGDRGALADLGVAPLPVALAWSRRVVEPVSAPPGDSSVYRDRISRARARAVQWFAIPCFVGVFAIIGMARGIWVGFFAALLVALSPNVIAHASLATTDMAFAMGYYHWFFLARRSKFTHRGGSWAIPGGALDEGESPLDGALREFAEEIGNALPAHTVVDVHESDHGGWSYWTVIVDVVERFPVPTEFHWETADARWVRRDELATLELFDAFAATLTELGLT